MAITFINREEEINTLKEAVSRKNSFIVVYGRRRIGKTELIKQVIKDKSNRLYLLCEEGYKINLLFLEKMIKERKGLSLKFKDYRSFFEYLKQTKEKWIVVFDEFQNIIEKRRILGEFQYIVDEIVKNSNIHFIILGSSISLMKSFLEYRSPLYGRRDVGLNLGELKFKDVVKFNNLPLEENVKIYGITGGVPYYVSLFSSFLDVQKVVFSKHGLLYNELDFIMGSEFKEYRVYKLILSALSQGLNRFNEIANYTGIQKTNLYIYLESLINVRFVKRVVPITKPLKTKNALYFINDKYIDFYFKFIEKYKPLIEMGDVINLQVFEKEYNTYLGKVFEDIAKQLLIDLKPINFTKIGKWWYKDKEIDIIAINEETKELLAVEVKWQDLKLRDVKSIINELHEKLPYVQWENDKRKEILGIFAKKVEKKAREWLVSQGYKVWDLSDVKKII